MRASTYPLNRWCVWVDDAVTFARTMQPIYGSDSSLLSGQRQLFVELLSAATGWLGLDAEVVISRAPVRANLMGRHIDHNGGFVNPIALPAEVLIVVEARQDDVVVVRNLEESRYPERCFSITDELPEGKISSAVDWDAWTMRALEKRMAVVKDADWVDYIKAVVVYFQEMYGSKKDSTTWPFRGMNVLVSGNAPASVGLGSSSALIVAMAQAFCTFNELLLPDSEFIQACGQGEWYVGTRGGSGDHAAILYARPGVVSRIGSFPTSVAHVPFPKGYRVVIFNSHERVNKAGAGRDVFNQRVACYELGMMMLHHEYPGLAEEARHLRDLTPKSSGFELAKVFETLLSLPERATLGEIRERISHDADSKVDRIVLGHKPPINGYPIRGVCLFGVAECVRSEMAADLLERNDLLTLGRMMAVSHDGDRRVRYDRYYEPKPYSSGTPDHYLRSLITASDSSHPMHEYAQLWRQPGAYGCSTPRIDMMVDVAQRVQGVVGAQISGAGLGGCMMVIVEEDRVSHLLRRMNDKIYAPNGLKPDFIDAVPVGGAGVISLE